MSVFKMIGRTGEYQFTDLAGVEVSANSIDLTLFKAVVGEFQEFSEIDKSELKLQALETTLQSYDPTVLLEEADRVQTTILQAMNSLPVEPVGSQNYTLYLMLNDFLSQFLTPLAFGLNKYSKGSVTTMDQRLVDRLLTDLSKALETLFILSSLNTSLLNVSLDYEPFLNTSRGINKTFIPETMLFRVKRGM